MPGSAIYPHRTGIPPEVTEETKMTTKTKTTKRAKAATKKAVAKAIKAAPKNPALDKALAKSKKKAEATTVDGRTHASTVENPCQLVWDLAEKMVPKGATRKEVMDAAQAKGVAFYTARTQYQLWSQASREQGRRRKEVGL